MSVHGRKAKALDGEEILSLWVEMGDLGRVYKFFMTEGRVNPSSGQPYSRNSLWRSAAIFSVEHPDEARPMYAKADAVFSDEEWELYILRRAMQVYKTSRSTFLRWVISHEWPRKYEPYYRDAFAVEPEDYDYFTQTMRRMGRPEVRVITKPLGRPPKNRGTVSE